MAQMETTSSTQSASPRSPVRIRKLGHVVIHVSDLERSMKFYTEVLNFRVSDRSPEGAYFLTSVGDHHTIGLFPPAGESAESTSKQAVRLHHFAMEVGSLDELIEARDFLKERGVRIVFEGRHRMGGHTAIEFLDPDGFQLELYCDMDRTRPDGRSRPLGSAPRATTLEAARDNPKAPTW
jgi:catechol 2,3-dioxygenase-like lactoylglutathione lyase family enzyme